jgi:dihydroorotase
VRLTIAKPDDWHLHLRDGERLKAVLPHTAARFARAIVMPNLTPPVTTTAAAAAYHGRIIHALAPAQRFTPLLTLYLTDRTPADEIDRARDSGIVHAVKLYPAGATTHSEAGVASISGRDEVFARMEQLDVPLLVHGEVTDPDVDPFDRERVFIERELVPLVRRFPRLRVVVEHATTVEAIEFVRAHPHTAATLTPQHLLFNRSALFAGGLRPHLYCLPVLKRVRDRRALLDAATSGSAQFFLGTDSAPHGRRAKEAASCCAGIYSAHAALELYAMAFESVQQLGRLEAFASHYGADFYRLPRNSGTVTLLREPWVVPASYPFVEDELVPLGAGTTHGSRSRVTVPRLRGRR